MVRRQSWPLHMVFEYGNVLILDEPTNHMDLVTKEVIEEGASVL